MPSSESTKSFRGTVLQRVLFRSHYSVDDVCPSLYLRASDVYCVSEQHDILPRNSLVLKVRVLKLSFVPNRSVFAAHIRRVHTCRPHTRRPARVSPSSLACAAFVP